MRAVVLELEMPQLLLFRPAVVSAVVHRMKEDGRQVRGL